MQGCLGGACMLFGLLFGVVCVMFGCCLGVGCCLFGGCLMVVWTVFVRVVSGVVCSCFLVYL